MAKNKDLQKAKANKKDEFYTQLVDIEKEMKYYRKHFKDKVILCNCDDPYESNFFKYFAINFNRLKLKKLVCIGYENSPIAGEQVSIFDNKETKPAHVLEINEVKDWNEDGRTDLADVEWLLKNNKNTIKELKGNGDFRSPESVEYLKEADIVVTNPPFSLFREYVAQLMEYGKKFIIIGSQNAITYKEIFPFIKDNKMWLGNGFSGNVGFFASPYEDKAKSSHHKEGLIRVSGVMWFTNIDIKKRHERLILYKEYDPDQYPHYENFDGIDIKETKNIPYDYNGFMGVPITFLDKYNPEQFELIGIGTGDSAKKIGITKNYRGRTDLEIRENGKSRCPFSRIIIRRK